MSAFLAQPIIVMNAGAKLAGMVICVHNANYVNAVAFDESGVQRTYSSLRFFGIDEIVPDGIQGAYCVPAGWE